MFKVEQSSGNNTLTRRHCQTGVKEKNRTQETCPDRGSNPGPLRGKSECYPIAQRRTNIKHEDLKSNLSFVQVVSFENSIGEKIHKELSKYHYSKHTAIAMDIIGCDILSDV